MLRIDAVNWEPNIPRVVRLATEPGGIRVEVYNTAADAHASSGLVAMGMSDGFGAVPVVLAPEPAAAWPITGLWSPARAWHIRVEGEAGDPSRVLAWAACLDLADIEHAVYVNQDLAGRRALAEINAHTHVVHAWDLAVARYVDAEPGQHVAVDSVRRGYVAAQVDEVRLEITREAVRTHVTARQYRRMTR